MTVTTFDSLWEGQLALVKVKGRGEVLVRIARRNPKNYRAELEDGSTVSGPHSLFRKAPEGSTFASRAPEREPLDHLDNGTVVRARPGTRLFRDLGSQFHVVVNCDREGKHRLFPLGGSKRYWRGILSIDLEVVPVSEINA